MRRRQLRSRRRRSNANAKIIVNEKNVKSEKTQKPKKIKGKVVQQQQQHMLFSSPDMETEDHDYIDNGDIDEFHRSQPYDDLGFSKNSDGFSMASTMGPLHLQGPLEKIKEYGSFEREDDDEQLPGGEDTSGSASTNQKDVDWDYSVQYLGDHYHDTNNDNDDDSHRRARGGVQDDSRKSPVSHDELRSPFGQVQKLNRSWSFPLTSPNVLELPPPPPPPPSLSKYELTPPRTRRKPLGDLVNSDANTHTNSNTKEEISTPTSTARKAQKWEEVINKAWDKNGLTSPLRNKQKSQRSEPSIQEQGQDETEGGARDRDRAGTVKKDSPGYMQFDADASQYVRKIPVEKTNNFASPSSVSTSTSAWVDQLSPTLSSPQSMTSKSMAAPTPSSSQSTNTNTNNQDPSNASRESLPSDIKPNLYITDSRVEISMGEMLDESRSRSQSNDNVNGMHTPARANTNDTLRSLISAAKSSFNSTRTQGAELCLDDLFSPSFINAVDLQSHCQNRTGIRLTPTVKSALDSISEIEGVSDGFAKMKSLLGTKSSSNRTEETELCVEDVFSQSFIHAMDVHPHGHGGNRIRVRSTPPTAVKSILDGISEDESVSDTSRLEQRHAAHDATNTRSSSATTCTSIFNNSSDMERWFSDKFSSRSAEDSTRSAMHHIESMIAASATKSSLNSTPEVERCIADLFDQSLANDSVMLRKGTMRSASASKFSLDSTLEVEHCVADVFDQSLANDSVMFRETSMIPASASKSSLNSTSEVEHCVADVFDQSLSNESLMGKQTTTRTRPASANIISLNSTIEVEQCVADVMEQTLAPDSAMKRHANSTSDSAAFSTTNSTIEVAECVADIMEQTLAPDSVMEHYRNSLFCGEMHSFPNGIMESSRSTMDHRERIDLLSKQASLSVADGDYEEALVALRKVLNIHLADHGEKHPLVASSHHNIGIVYSKRANDALSNTDADESNGFALKSFHTAAQIARKMVGKSHPNVAVSLARIGLIYLQMRKYGDADITFEECLRIRKKVFGKKHPLVAKVYNNLGVAKLHMDNDEGALKAFESAGAIQKRCLKKVKHTNVDKSYKLQLELADTLCNVGTICLDLIERRKDRNDEAALLNPQLGEQAIDAFDEVLSIRTKCLGSDHALVGETKKLQKDANKLYQMSITQSERERSTVDDEESCLISKSDNSMSIPQSEGHISTCSGAGDDEESCLISNAGNEVGPGMPSAWKENSSQHGFSFLGSRTSARADSGDNDKITEMNNLAEQSLKDEKLEKSLLIFQDLLIHYKSTYGELHHLVGSTLHNIGIVLLRLHQHEAAISSFQQAVRVRRGSIGRDHPDVAVSLVKVGITQLLLKQFEDALFTFREALSVRRHALGHLHPSTARIYNNIGCVHVEFNELKEARRAFESALDVQRNALCYEPDSTQLLFGAATTLCNLGYLYTHRGAHNKTSLVLEEALVLQQRVFDACHPTVLSILDSLADSCGRSGDNANAVTHYKEVIARLEGSNGSVTGDDNGNGNGIDENNHKNLNVHSNNTPIRSKRKRRALAIVKYKLSKVYRNQNDFECALKSLRESFSYVNDESETETPTSDLMQKVKDEIVEVENELKNTDLDWL